MENLEGFTATSVDGTPVQEQQIQTNEESTQQQTQSESEGVVQETVDQEAQVDAVQERPAEEVSVREQASSGEEVREAQQEENQEVENTFETTTIEYGKEESKEEKPTDTVEFDKPQGVDLLTFIEENKDLISSYDKLNRNFDEMDDTAIVAEHLKLKHKNLSQEDIDTLLSDYSYDEETDDRADIVKKKIALANAVTTARDYMTTQSETLRQELATRNLGGPTKAELEAQAVQQEAVNHFNQTTSDFFGSQEFEGFAFQLNDDKGMNLKINNKEVIKKNQASIETFLQPFFDESGKLSDPQGYHRAIFAAMNIDAITKNAYEQGKSDAITQTEKDAKNIDMDSRQTHNESQGTGSGTKWTIS